MICTRWPAMLYADYWGRGFAAVVAEPCDVQEVLDLVASLCGARRESTAISHQLLIEGCGTRTSSPELWAAMHQRELPPRPTSSARSVRPP